MKQSRRTFLATASLAVGQTLCMPSFLAAEDKKSYTSSNAGDFYRPADKSYSILDSVADSLRI